jgi:sarcosine oxidase
MERTEVVVIGAGVMGSAAARSLGARGVSTVLLEQFNLGHTRGSSHGAVRIFRFSYPLLDYVRLAQRALPLWRRLEDEAGERLLITTGGIDAGPHAGLCADALEACGAAVEWVDQAEATERFPAIAFEGLGRVMHQPDGGVCLADRTVAAQVRLARSAGVDVREEAPALRILPLTDGVRVETQAGAIQARVAVVTAGGWARSLVGDVLHGSGGVPLVPTLQHVAHFEPRDGGSLDGTPTFVEWMGPDIVHYAVPPVGVAPGLKVGDHVVGPQVDPAEGPFPVREAALAPIADYVSRRFRGVDPLPVAAETCLYTIAPDEDFVLDRVGDVVIGAGFSGHGFKFGPLVGEILADLAMGLDPEIPAERFAASRPAMRRA